MMGLIVGAIVCVVWILINLRNYNAYRVDKDRDPIFRISYLLNGFIGGIILGTVAGLLINVVTCAFRG